MKFLGYIVVAVIVLFGVVIIIGQFTKDDQPQTYGDVAAGAQEACERKYPDAPASYCAGQGAIEGLSQLCKDKPWECPH